MKDLGEGLSEKSSIHDLLRALFRLNGELVRVRSGHKVRFFHKEQLFALVERGWGGKTLISLSSEPGLGRAAVERLAPQTVVLDLLEGRSCLSTVGESDSLPLSDPWFDVPLPVVCLHEGALLFNEEARSRWGELQLPLETLRNMATGEEEAFESEGRHFMIRHLGEGRYFLEDVSLDFLTAQEIVWWAAVGKALVSRMKENGASIERFAADSRRTREDKSLLPCVWEGNLLGYIAVRQSRGEGEGK
ncbi:hypothetical protein KAR29_02975 [Aminithiophilus ramosus]|uniref:Uncharacterized protein n=2 Tax=Synergistales TaxID=649776 RepID=A0A9Q7A975_9BACT|nr:hypothetical protein [Aminithiophilus ramosus]QTX32895.1 hypothetical protein KAR29_02975 [Aminithiophilus ramosus]QVL37340.1 hypothetical protein KIH16_06235 [Synergistota bacterium]